MTSRFNQCVLQIVAVLALAATPLTPSLQTVMAQGNDWLRRQQADEQRRRQQDAERQRQADRQREQERQRQAERQRQQEQQRQRMREQERQRLIDQQRQKAINDNQKGAVPNAPGGGTGAGPGATTPKVARNGMSVSNKTADRVTYSNGLSKLTRPPTTAEMKRGFTGKITPDGRALVRVRGRVYTVPASRIGVRVPAKPAPASAKWTETKRATVNESIKKVASSKPQRRQTSFPAGFATATGQDPKLDAQPLLVMKYLEQNPRYANDNNPVLGRNLPRGARAAVIVAQPRREPTPAERAQHSARMADWTRMGGYPPNEGFVSKALVRLQPGFRVSRYGDEYGAYSSPHGTSFDGRGLPPSQRNSVPRVFEVIKTIPALEGEAANVSNKETGEIWNGGASQLLTTKTIDQLVTEGYIKEIPPDSALNQVQLAPMSANEK